MLRFSLVVLVVALGALVVLWQFGVIRLGPSGPSEAEIRLSTLFELARGLDPAALEETVAELEDPNIRDAEGRTLLMVATAEGSLAGVRVLVEAGINLDAATASGETALMFAAGSADTATIPLLLLNAGADPTLEDVQGRTASDYARDNAAVGKTGLYQRLEELTGRSFVSGWPSGYLLPIEGGTISSRSNHLPGAPRAYRNGTHEGFDFYNGTVGVPIEYGTPIRAVAMGTVLRADHDFQELTQEALDENLRLARTSLDTPAEILDLLRGRQVWIRHPGGFISRYAHLSGIPADVVEGAEVIQGQVIGATGNSGTPEAVQGTQDDPHPHVELWSGNTYLGYNLEPEAIYSLAAQVFGEESLPREFE